MEEKELKIIIDRFYQHISELEDAGVETEELNDIFTDVEDAFNVMKDQVEELKDENEGLIENINDMRY